jgi:hypothetical protein
MTGKSVIGTRLSFSYRAGSRGALAGSPSGKKPLERAPNVLLRGHSADCPCRGWIVSRAK